MGLPLPKVVADVEAGGPYVTSAKGLNALRTAEAEARYKPMTLQADAASKLAYANLMGPQFLAKLMANDPILANMSEEQKTTALQKLYQAGSGQGTGANIFSSMGGGSSPFSLANNNGSLIGGLLGGISGMAVPAVNKLMEKLGISSPSQVNSLNQPVNNGAISQGSQIQPYNNQGSYSPSASQADQYGNIQPKGTFAENTATQGRIVEGGKESGKIIAQDIKSFGDQIESGLAINDKYNTLSDLVNNPEFRTMRENIPFFQGKQLSVLSKIGTPVQKELVGQFGSAANELMGDIIRSFGAQKFRGESDIAKNMKINEDDAFNVIIGKLQAGMLYKNLQTQRARIASDIMEREHITKAKALQRADEQIDGEKTRNDIAAKLDYSVSIRRRKNDGSYETITVPVSEARKRGVKNV